VRPPLDLRVAIERVHVRAGVLDEPASRPGLVTGYLGGRTGAPLHDHRIVIRELHIDVEATLDGAAAHRLGKDVAWELAGRLAGLQERRWPRIAGTPSAGGPIFVETLRVHLWGDPERHPPAHQISAALMNAFEERVLDG
jgi:hypothetical protein